ncbi:hypothetical protein J2S04_000744 [Alicyclobacillus tengchongensis]|uniref:Uncharacterized protein n=1 Tax=Alicyclobacillus tolerans TaxID=90970 RepID=A0ABT9LU68_9BACL|nr:hypothetical protein [Alicyclobacillus tengchongensis]
MERIKIGVLLNVPDTTEFMVIAQKTFYQTI